MAPCRQAQRLFRQLYPWLVMAVYVWLLLLAGCCDALPTYASPATAERDRRVAELRAALLSDGSSADALPEAPLELGLHTACKKFGRGCPEAYVSFLEEHVARVRGEKCATATAGEKLPADLKPAEKHDRTQAEEGTESAAGDANGTAGTRASESATAGPSQDTSLVFPTVAALRLPVQPSWSYEQFKRAERTLVRIKLAQAQLDKTGVSSHALQRQHGVPRGEQVLLQDDALGELAAHLATVCAHPSEKKTHPAPNATTAVEAEVACCSETEVQQAHAAWCRFTTRRDQLDNPSVDAVGLHAALDPAFPFQSVPATPLRCYKLEAWRILYELLLFLDPLLNALVVWTASVALPSALVTAVVLWVGVGAGWGEAAEQLIFGAPIKTEPQSHPEQQQQQQPQEAEEEGEAAAAASHPVPGVEAERQYQQSRLAALRYTYVTRTLHRSWHLSFVKLRLVLCLAVGVGCLCSFAQVVYPTLRGATGGRPAMSASRGPGVLALLNVALQLLPAWLRVALNVYLIAFMQGAMLLMALKGALGAYADWQDFVAQCATEQEYLLKAVDDVQHRQHESE